MIDKITLWRFYEVKKAFGVLGISLYKGFLEF